MVVFVPSLGRLNGRLPLLAILICLGMSISITAQERYPNWLSQVSEQLTIDNKQWVIVRELSGNNCPSAAMSAENKESNAYRIEGIFTIEDQHYWVVVKENKVHKERLADTDGPLRVMDAYWSALRDDMVKPYRVLPSDGKQEEPCGMFIDIFLNHRAINITKSYNQRDLDPQYAKENLSYGFNQTLKLKTLHEAMDSLFLRGPLTKEHR